MKYLILILSLALVGCQTAKPKRAVQVLSPDVAVVKAPIERAKQSTAKAAQSVDVAKSAVTRSQAIAASIVTTPEQAPAVEQLKMELNQAADDLTNAQANLNSTSTSLTEANVRADVLQKEVKELRDTAITQTQRADTAEADLATEKTAHQKTTTAYHKLKFFVAGLLALIAGALAFACTSFLINPLYRGLAALAAGSIVFAAAWSIL